MLFETNKQKGNSGLAAAIGYYGLQGYTISIPLNDTQDYDLIVDNGQKLLKVQVKATGQRTPQGYSTVSLKSCGGTKGTTYKTIVETDIDLLFIFTELQEIYEIPIKDIVATSTLNLGPERQKYRKDTINTEYVKKDIVKKEYFCKKCNTKISKNYQLCNNCAAKNRRVVDNRPTKEELLNELKNSNFSAVGRKYNVSDNAIRKWCDSYGLPRTIKEIKLFVIE